MKALPLCVLMALALCTGCDVISEINSEIGYSEAELAKDKPAETDSAAAREEGGSVAQRTATWWRNAKNLGPREDAGGDDALVRCRVANSERFTRSRDCHAAGGTVLR